MKDRLSILGDEPLTFAPPTPPEIVCETEWSDCPPIRLQPSKTWSSLESDRIISKWRPRIANLCDAAIAMVEEFRRYPEGEGLEMDWKTKGNPYPFCPFLLIIEPAAVGRDMRLFCEEACRVLLQASTGEEALDAHWFDGRLPDARDVMEWLSRWSVWLPDEFGQFEFWSIFMPCEQLESLYRYVHDLVHDYYLEILELHTLWEERMQNEGPAVEGGIPGSAVFKSQSPELIRYWHPRLIIDDQEIHLTGENAAEFFAFAIDFMNHFHSDLDEEAKEALKEAAYEAWKIGNPS